MMPKVSRCGVTKCAFNRDENCHAPAITVGKDEPLCDTFIESSAKAGEAEATGSVGACKVKNCQYNKRLECSAARIVVELNDDDPTCMTFEAKTPSAAAR